MAVDADPRIGTSLAGYRIEAPLGQGGMGVVYRAHDEALDRSVAVKLISPGLAADRDFRDRFLVEARMAASLDHPNVIPVHDAGDIDGQLYLAMRYVEGTDLRELLAVAGQLEPERALAICGQVAQALDVAHERGLVHRDVKPSNVLLDEREHAYLADFGLTRRLSDAAPDFDAGLSIGTPAYVSPEQIEGNDVGPRADQYSLACMLYECLTGEPPFRRDTEAATLYAHLEDEPPDYPGLEPVFAKALAKDPDDRYDSCGALIEAARIALLGPRRRRRVLAAALAGAVLVAAAIVAAVLVLTGGDEAVVGHDWTRAPHNESVFGGTLGTAAEGIASGASGLVAVGATGRFEEDTEGDAAVWASLDGLTWVRVSDDSLGGPGAQSASAVAADESGYTAVGIRAPPAEKPEDIKNDAAVWRSTDGRRWRLVDSESFGVADNQAMSNVTAGPSGLVVVGISFLFDPMAIYEGAIWTSPDGETWRRLLPSDPQLFRPQLDPSDESYLFLSAVAEAEGGPIVVVGEDSGRQGSVGAVWVSEDGGESWARLPHDDVLFGDGTTGAALTDVAAGEAGFVIVGTEDEGGFEVDPSVALAAPGPKRTRTMILTSPDGQNWSRVRDTSLPGSVALNAITYGEQGYAAAGWRRNNPGVKDADIDPVVWTSPDGQTWTEAADPAGVFDQPGGQLIADITVGGPGLVAIGQDGDTKSFNTAIWTSP